MSIFLYLSYPLPHLWCCSAGAKCTSLSLATSMQGSVSWFLWRTSPFSTIAQAWCCNESASRDRTWNQLSKTCPLIFVTSLFLCHPPARPTPIAPKPFEAILRHSKTSLKPLHLKLRRSRCSRFGMILFPHFVEFKKIIKFAVTCPILQGQYKKTQRAVQRTFPQIRAISNLATSDSTIHG